MTLREYQATSIEKLRQAFREGKRRVIYYLATGGGKSMVASEIIRMATDKGKSVAFVCNRIELVKQASDHFSKRGIRHGIIQGQNSHSVGSSVLVCSIQTIARRGYPPVDMLIIDEAHACAGSEAYQALFKAYNNVKIVGLTATPFSKGLGRHYDQMDGSMFEEIVVGATIPELIEAGFLVDVDIYAPSEPDLSKVRVVAGDYEGKSLGEAVDQPKLIGDIVAHYIRLAMGKMAIVFATNVAHSQHIVGEFQKQGIDARHVDGYMTDEERRPIIQAFKDGEFPILSNCSLLAEGFDAPETSVIILARPTKSLIRFIQMAGRALRPFHGKDKALILDHSGVVKRLGFPTDELPLVLDDGKPKEKKPNENLPKVCKSCFAVFKRSLRVCPVCGFEAVMTPKEIEQEAGELKKLEKKKVFTRERKQEIYSALCSVRAQKNYQNGWVSHNYRDLTGVWPTGLDDKSGPMIDLVQNHLTHKAIKFANSPDRKPKPRLDHCPKCKYQDFDERPGSGPHAAGRKCRKCGCFWWLPKEAA